MKRLISAIGCLVFLLSGAGQLAAHRYIPTNIDFGIEIHPEELIYRVSIATFLLPPLQGVRNGAVPPVQAFDTAGLADFFHERCSVAIDGVPVRPIVDELEFEPREDAPHLGGFRNLVTAHFALRYPFKNKPRQIRMQWGLYPMEPFEGWGGLADPDQDPELLVIEVLDRGDINYAFFSPQEPEHIWHDLESMPLPAVTAAPIPAPRGISLLPWLLVLLLPLPFLFGSRLRWNLSTRVALAAGLLVAAVALGSMAGFHPGIRAAKLALPDDEEALEIFRALHANVYRAFDYERDTDIYDALNQSVDGNLLQDLYTRVYSSLVLRESGGAVSKVTDVAILDAAVVERGKQGSEEVPTFTVRCNWQVTGVVEHWGHLHRRVNRYGAKFRLAPAEGAWKIFGLEMESQSRVATENKPV